MSKTSKIIDLFEQRVAEIMQGINTGEGDNFMGERHPMALDIANELLGRESIEYLGLMALLERIAAEAAKEGLCMEDRTEMWINYISSVLALAMQSGYEQAEVERMEAMAQ